MEANMPYVKQEKDFYCGPAIVQMLLAKKGVVVTQTQLAKELKTTEEIGTNLVDIVCVLLSNGFSADQKDGASLDDIARALRENKIVIVCYTGQSHNEPHYAIVLALTDKEIVLADPFFGERREVSISEFLERWHGNNTSAYGDRAMVAVG